MALWAQADLRVNGSLSIPGAGFAILDMRRADRLFQLIQQLRPGSVITARELAERLAVSERTIYRDVQDLSLSGVPIVGEAGAGYRMLPGFHLPPLMFSVDELAALLLGARMVQVWTDKNMAHAAKQAISKIESVIPAHLKPELAREELLVPDFSITEEVASYLALLREAIKQQHKVSYDYIRQDGVASSRIAHPLGLLYWGKVWTLVAWCELRDAFRHFRLDRIQRITVLGERFHPLPGRSLQDFLRMVCDECEPSASVPVNSVVTHR